MSIETIIQKTCTAFSLSKEEMNSRKRTTRYVVCRGFIAYFLKKHTNLSLSKIGIQISRDHANVLHLLSLIETYKKMDVSWYDLFNSLEDEFCIREKTIVCPTCGHTTHDAAS